MVPETSSSFCYQFAGTSFWYQKLVCVFVCACHAWALLKHCVVIVLCNLLNKGHIMTSLLRHCGATQLPNRTTVYYVAFVTDFC